MPAPAARLAGFALLAALGALEWRRMVESVTTLRALVWVLAGVLAAGLLIGAARVTGRLRPAATVAAALGGLAAAVALSGVDLELFVRSSRWGELGDGLVTGTDALGGAQLPYRGADPWPGVTLALSGALLVTIAALIAFWPRGRRQGSPLGALIVLLTLVVTPVAALPGQPRPALGLAAAALTACFLFLERLPVRPGASAVVLAVSALAIALPLGAAADRDEPFFDYKSFAESLGPVEPVTFNWNQGYGPIRWPRDGRELFRVKTSAPAYWKAEVLSDFDGERWRLTRRQDPDNEDPLFDLPPSWEARSSSWNRTARITLRRLQTDDVIGAGTILRVSDISRGVTASPIPGGWLASRELGRGDSYTVESHVPKPSTRQMRATNTGWDGLHANELELRLPFRAGAMEGSPRLPQPEPGSAPRYVGWAQLEFPAFGLAGPPVARYPLLDVTGDGRDAIRRSSYERTWRMVQRLRRGSETALDYVLRVNAFLRSDSFRYTEVPEQPPADVPPLEFFLHDSRAGYCQHFAGAMALMLRMGGVPARVATGFTPGGLRK
jgi:transglutaminase-like putative cysteine protease